MAAALFAPPLLVPAKPALLPRRAIVYSARAAASSSDDAKGPWWEPLFWTIRRKVPVSVEPVTPESGSAVEEAGKSMLTAEKARVLRRETRAKESWHDAMYHSAIASRLASPDGEM